MALFVVGGVICCGELSAGSGSPPQVIATLYTDMDVTGLTWSSAGRIYYAEDA